MVGMASRTNMRMYRNLGVILETTASWFANDLTSPDMIMGTAGDVTGDGLRDLIVADNNQLSGGSGRFRQYNGTGSGFLKTASWSYLEGYCSAVALADVDADGRLDLATGAWWDYTRIFLNTGTGFGASPNWSSGVTSVIEKIAFGDIDKNGLAPYTETIPAVSGRKLYYLSRQPIQEITSVRLDGTPLALTQFTFSREHGWVSVQAAPVSHLEVSYTYSSKLDMAVTNWDSNVGNYVYYNQLIVKGDANCDGRADLADIEPFTLLLTDHSSYIAVYPDCDVATFCDMNDDGILDGLDIQGFVQRLISGV